MESNAVVDPGAVVVESLHAPITDVAVARVSCEDYLTPRAELAWLSWVAIEFLDQLTERDLWVTLHVSWLGGCCQCEEHLERDEQKAQERKPCISIDVGEDKEYESDEGAPEHGLAQYEHLSAWQDLLQGLLQCEAWNMSRLLGQQDHQLILSVFLIVVSRHIWHEINWPLTIVVLDCSVCPFDQQLLDGSAVIEIVRISYCNMERCVSLRILLVDFHAP